MIGFAFGLSYSVEIPCLENHPRVGGRFSMFSPVGMLTAELIGLSSTKLLEGAKDCFKDFKAVVEISKNPIATCDRTYFTRKMHRIYH